MRRGWALALLLAALAAFLPAPPARAAVAVVILDGRGYGHGVGLPQYGARYLAEAGASWEEILATFYPGTELAGRSGDVRVAIHSAADNTAVLAFPGGGEVRSSLGGEQAAGFPVVVPAGGQAIVRKDDAGYHVAFPAVAPQSATGPQQLCLPPLIPCPPPPPPPPTEPPPPPTEPPPSTEPPPPGEGPPPGETPPTEPPVPGPPTESVSASPVWAVPAGGGVTDVPARGRSYRGVVEATGDAGQLRLVNQLDVETYVKGLAEMPSGWHSDALAAQAVAGRTYALRAMSFAGELCDYDRCQVYVGAGRETERQSQAVDATSGVVATYGGALASTMYSADAGGVTATPQEGFGTPNSVYPYLQTVPYDTPDPLPWHAEIALTDVAARLGYPGTLTSVAVGATGPSGRALEVVLDGSTGPQAVAGRGFASALGLRSTLFSASLGTSDGAPAVPAPGVMQALPEDAATIDAAATLPAEPDAARPGMKDFLAGGRWPETSGPDLAGDPATLVALGLLAAATVLAMARYGDPSRFLRAAGSTVGLGDQVPRFEAPPRPGAWWAGRRR